MGKLVIGLGAVVLALIVAFVLFARWAGRWTSEVAAPPVAVPASVPRPSPSSGVVSLAQVRADQQRQAAAAAPSSGAAAHVPAPTVGSGGRCENLLPAGARLHAWWRGSGAAPEAVLVLREARPEGDRGDFTAAFTPAGRAAQEPVRGRWSGERFVLTRTVSASAPGPQQWEGRCHADGTIRGRWTSSADGDAGMFRLAPP